MALSKLPAIQFYPGDWKKDIGVQSLSFHDRGVWFEMLLLMHDSPVRGKLMIGAKAMTTEMLAKALHISDSDLESTIETLIEHGVTEREKRTGALINRRMLRDENDRASTRERVTKWRKSQKTQVNGNADVTAMKQECTDDVTPMKQRPSSSVSSSSSSSSSKQISEAKASSPRTDSGKLDPIEAIYQEYPRKVGKRDAAKAIARAVQHVAARGMPIREAQVWLYHRVQEYARSPAGMDGEFTPHPATWFNRGSYDDDQTQWQAKQGERHGNGNRPQSRSGLSAGDVEEVTEIFRRIETGEAYAGDRKPVHH